jgi:hypothetical protein
MAREKVKQVQVFSLPTEYERQAAEARRREMMAEMLAQQAYDPGQYQGAPIPKAAPVVKALEGYLRGREMRKAREAGEKAKAEVSRAGQQIMGRLMGGAPIAEPVMPDASGLDEVRVQSQYRASPDDAMRMAMTPAGSAAMRGNPALAAMLARTMEKPEAEEFYAPTETERGLVQFGKRGGRKDTGYVAAPKAASPTELSRLITERDALAPNDPQRSTYDAAIRKATVSAPTAVVNLDTKGSQLGQELYIKKIDALSTPATNANRIINQVGAMEDATKKGTFTGAMAPNAVGAAQFLSSFGIDVKPDILANSRAFQAASNQLVLDFMASNGGARGFTEKETAILQDAFPKIVDSPEARQQIATLLRNRAKKDVSDYNQAVETYRKSFPNSPIPYGPIEDTEARYEKWKRSQGVR